MLENLNGFVGCFDYPFVYLDMNQIELEFADTNVQARGRWYKIISSLTILLNILYCVLYWNLVVEQMEVA